jgi:hypothetical protein
MSARPFTVIDVEQRSVDWFAARCGCVTSSRAADVISFNKPRSKTAAPLESAKRKAYRAEKVVERLTGRTQEDRDFTPAYLQRGVDMEASAIRAYEAETGTLVRRSGFLKLANGMPVGASLDGYVGDYEGIVEVKCPQLHTHYGYIMSGPPPDYLAQITHQLFVTGAAWCDFVSYDDRFPEAYRLLVVRVPRTTVNVDAYALALGTFLGEVERDLRVLETSRSLSRVLMASIAASQEEEVTA